MWELLPETASEAQGWFRLLRQLLQVHLEGQNTPTLCALVPVLPRLVSYIHLVVDTGSGREVLQ